MDIIDNYRITPDERIYIAETLTGLSARDKFGSYNVNWKIGGYCKLDKEEPTNHVHFHNCWEGHIVLSGSGILKDERGVHSLTPGSILVTAPKIQHEILVQDKESLSLLWFMFDILPGEKPDSIRNWESRLIAGFLERHHTVSRQAGEIFTYLSFIRGYEQKVRIIDHWIIRNIKEMLLFFLEKLSFAAASPMIPENKSDSVFQKILDLVSNDIERKFSVPELAGACGMSPRSIQYLFKESLGITLTEYIAEIKANHAARALLRGVRVQKAGETIGIPDPAQFSRFFKKHFGIPPVRYRQRSLEQLDFFSTTFGDTGYRKFV